MSVKYWPSEVGTPGLFGSFQVELSENEKDKGDYVTRKFKLSHVDAVSSKVTRAQSGHIEMFTSNYNMYMYIKLYADSAILVEY